MITLKDEYLSASEKDTKMIAGLIAEKNYKTIGLIGEIGCGKTVFSSGFFEKLGVKGINSPSFVIMNEYTADEKKLYHIDLYRYNVFEDDFGFWDIMENGDAVIVEWAEKLGDDISVFDLVVYFEYVSATKRKLILRFLVKK